nr:MAG TPA: hypothetical protein [Caudoviricetes sp.]
MRRSPKSYARCLKTHHLCYQLATSTKLTKYVNAIHLMLSTGYISGGIGRRLRH